MSKVNEILKKIKEGELSIDEAEKLLRLHAVEELGEHLKLDIHREERAGVPEVVLARRKDLKTVIKASRELAEKNGLVLVTKLSPARWQKAREDLSEGFQSEYTKEGRILVLKKEDYERPTLQGKVGILTGGTADLPIAREAEVTCRALGCQVVTEYDVGISSLSRTLTATKRMIREEVNVLIVIAGMEGSLPSVISSLVRIPIVAVPTDTGYGFGKEGIAPALTMINSCSPGLSLVNINNGFGAAAFSALFLRQIDRICKRNREGI